MLEIGLKLLFLQPQFFKDINFN